jgi:hypothetical protein
VLNLLKGILYYSLLLSLIYVFRYKLWDLTPLLLIAILPTILLRQIELRRNLSKKAISGRRGYIYAFSDIGQIVPTLKIGRETEKGSRMRSHRTAAPFNVIVWCNFYVPDSVAAEAYLHNYYRWMRVSRHNEWFYVLNPLMLIDLIILGWFSRK